MKHGETPKDPADMILEEFLAAFTDADPTIHTLFVNEKKRRAAGAEKAESDALKRFLKDG